MTDPRSSAPPFTLKGVTWTCFIVESGHAFEWRSACGALRVGRQVTDWWAEAHGRCAGRQHSSARMAMAAALDAAARFSRSPPKESGHGQ